MEAQNVSRLFAALNKFVPVQSKQEMVFLHSHPWFSKQTVRKEKVFRSTAVYLFAVKFLLVTSSNYHYLKFFWYIPGGSNHEIFLKEDLGACTDAYPDGIPRNIQKLASELKNSHSVKERNVLCC